MVYAHSGDQRILDKARKVWSEVPASDLEQLTADQPSDMHGVTFAEVSKLAALLFMYTGDTKQRDISVAAMRRIFKYHMLSDGTPSTTEKLRGTSALDGHETCDIVEFNISWSYLLMATGSACYGDRIERALFNAGMGAVRKDWSGFQYISCPNQVHMARNSCQPTHLGTAAALYGPNSDHRPEYPVFGAAVYFNDPAFLEICAHLGFQVMWIEMEHAHITFAEAVNLCRISQGCGLLTMIRIPNASRENVLKAAECAPDIINVPMANSAHELRDLTRYARFAPVGERGYFSVSRAVKYGLVPDVPAEQQRLNDELCLMAQIETSEAVANCEEICSVPGVDIFIGPSDLAASLGVPGQTGHSRVEEAAQLAIKTAKKHGKLVAVGAQPADFRLWVKAGVDVLFCTNDTSRLRIGAATVLQRAQDALSQAREETLTSK